MTTVSRFSRLSRGDAASAYETVSNGARYYRQGKLPEWLKEELESIPGWSWDPRQDERRRKLKVLRRYVDRYGWKRFNTQTKAYGVNLGSWVNCVRTEFTKGKLSNWLREELEAIPGWRWWAKG
jgi:hypothetical protein